MSSVPILDGDASRKADRFNKLVPAIALTVSLAYWKTWLSFPPAWILGRQHGFAVAAFSAWLLWRARAALLSTARPFNLASVAVAVLSFAWLIGYVLNVQVVHQAAVPVLLACWWLAVAGLASFRRVLPAVLVFFLAVPVWGLLNYPLQRLTVLANGVMLRFTNIRAEIQAEYIAIPAGVFEVAQGCSGLNYLESALFIGVIYAMLFLQSWQPRLAAVCLAAVLALVSNWIRVFGLVLIGQITNMQSSLIKEHNVYGWLIFAVVIALFFVLVKRIEAWDSRLVSFVPQSDEQNDSRAVTRNQTLTSIIPPTLAALVGPVTYLFLAGSPSGTAPDTLGASISPGSEWSLVDGLVSEFGASLVGTTPWKPAFVGADEYRSSIWTDGSDSLQLDRIIYVQQRQGKELIGNDNRIAVDSLVLGGSRVGPLDASGRFVNASVVRTDAGPRLVWYWYRVAGFDVQSGADAKLLELVSFVTDGPPSELVAVSSICHPTDEKCEQATRRVYSFIMGRPMSE